MLLTSALPQAFIRSCCCRTHFHPATSQAPAVNHIHLITRIMGPVEVRETASLLVFVAHKSCLLVVCDTCLSNVALVIELIDPAACKHA
jgi:hypothetical protein